MAQESCTFQDPLLCERSTRKWGLKQHGLWASLYPQDHTKTSGVVGEGRAGAGRGECRGQGNSSTSVQPHEVTSWYSLPSYTCHVMKSKITQSGEQLISIRKKILKAIRFCSGPITGHIYGQNHNSQRYMCPYVHSSTIHNSQDMEITYMEITDEEIKKMWYIYTRKLLSHKKEQNNAICNNMGTMRDYHTIQSKSERKRHTIL